MNLFEKFGADWPAISALLDQMLDLPAAERAAWLASLSGIDERHRDALRSLLAQQSVVEPGDRFLGELPAIGSADTALQLTGIEIGAEVGAYRLIAQIGQGGMGTVWLAERLDALTKRRVALKLPHIVWGDTFAERLAREREILATLEHEHIARLYDAGIDAHGRPFLAMEYVEGESLDDYCRTRRLSVRERIGLVLQVCGAVSHAHSRLIVHRDLKPRNIIVTHDGNVKLLDFGVAKLLEGDATLRTALTEVAGRALTLDYASPEQIRGDPLGTSSDVYSLGVVAYELLADVKPYRLRRGSAAELEEAILATEPPRASDAAEQPATRKVLRGDLDAVLGRALKKDVRDRYPTVDAFAQDLGAYLRGEPVQARPDSARYRAGKFVLRHRGAVAMSTALLVSVVAGSVVSFWQARVAREQGHRATIEAARQQAVRDLYREAQSRLAVMAVDHPDALAKPGAVTTALVDKLHEMASRYADRPQERAAQLEAVMLQLNYDGRFEESLQVGKEYLAQLIANKSDAVPVMMAYGTQGSTLFQLNRWDDSEAMRRAGMDWAPDDHAVDTEKMRVGLASDLGGILAARGKRQEALAVLNRADAILSRVRTATTLRYALTNKFGLVYLGFDDTKALETMRRARAEMLADGSADADQQAYNGSLLGGALLATGSAAEAESVFKRSLEFNRREFGRGSNDAIFSFTLFVSAVARQDAQRAIALIDEERRTLSAEPAGVSKIVDLSLQGQRFDAHWIAGDSAAALPAALPDVAPLLAAPGLRRSRFFLVSLSRALVQAGRAPDALRVIQTLQSKWPERGMPTAFWLGIQQTFAEAQLGAAQPAAAARSAGELMQLLEAQQATGGAAYRCAATVAAVSNVRNGDRVAASRLLARLDAAPLPIFPSPAERAECELRRAQALSELGRAAEATAIVRARADDLAAQVPSSPRLALARRISEAGAP